MSDGVPLLGDVRAYQARVAELEATCERLRSLLARYERLAELGRRWLRDGMDLGDYGAALDALPEEE